MTYIVSKRKGVWTVGAGGVVMNFDDYSSAIDTARGAAQVLKSVRARGNQASAAEQRPVFDTEAVTFSRTRCEVVSMPSALMRG